jgi:hypothetical protein
VKISAWLKKQDVRVVITTLGRPQKQTTLQFLLDAKLQPELIVQKHEAKIYKKCNKDVTITVLPRGVDKLHTTRQWLLENTDQRFLIILDDDLRFNVRRTDNPGRFLRNTPRDTRKMFRALVRTLKKYAHVSVASRQGANFQRKDLIATRMQRLLAYDLRKVRKTGVRFDRVNPLSDFDMILQLLEAGYPNRVLHKWVHDETGGFNAAGGCSIWRTKKRLRKAQRWLRKTHGKEIITITQRQFADGSSRSEVRIAWKKAFQEAT